MKVKLKQVKGDTFEVEAGEDETVGVLKQKVAEARPEFPAEQQTLIYAGKILKDESKVQEIGLKPGDFVVVLYKAKTAAPKAAAAPPAQEPAAPAAPAAAPAAAAQVVAPQPAGVGDSPAIQQLCDMGFARPEVERCLAAAFGNPDRAVDYLMSGIPPGVAGAAGGGPPQAAPAANQGASAPPAAGGVVPFPAMGAPGGGDDDYDDEDDEEDLPPELEELRNNPQFEQLAAMVVQNPQMLEQMLGALAQTNPELVQAIRQNPEAFMHMVEDAVGVGEDEQDEDEAFEAMLAVGGGGAIGGDPSRSGQLVPEDDDAIARLMALGFDRQTCVQAYLLCDRNEELAANFLFDNGGDMAD